MINLSSGQHLHFVIIWNHVYSHGNCYGCLHHIFSLSVALPNFLSPSLSLTLPISCWSLYFMHLGVSCFMSVLSVLIPTCTILQTIKNETCFEASQFMPSHFHTCSDEYVPICLSLSTTLIERNYAQIDWSYSTSQEPYHSWMPVNRWIVRQSIWHTCSTRRDITNTRTHTQTVSKTQPW